MTGTGTMLGTPYYMSPEQSAGEFADARSDVYALGCVLYELLSGETVFDGTTPLAVLRKHMDEQPRPIRVLRDDVPQELAEIVMRSLHKDPDLRQ
jgi:serine/threonine-protein kinase